MSNEHEDDWNPGDRWFTPGEIDRGAAAFMASIDPKQHVGHRHHLVPRFVLARFANVRDQVYVRDRTDNRASDGLRNIRDLAIKDFYTFIDNDGELNSSFEYLLGEIEAAASNVMREHIDNPFTRPRPFSLVERMAIDGLVSMQAIRGHDQRRSGEVLVDYYVKTTNQQNFSEQDLTDLEIVPHQNDHLMVTMALSSKVHRHLTSRACFLVTLDRPLLVTCDEPVLLHFDEPLPRHSQRQLNDHPRDVRVDGVPPEDLIQVTGTNLTGLVQADGIIMPVGPRHAVMYLEPDTAGPVEHQVLSGSEADSFA